MHIRMVNWILSLGSDLLHYTLYLMSHTIWDYTMLYLFTVHLKFYQQMSNRLFGHYRTIIALLGKKCLQ